MHNRFRPAAILALAAACLFGPIEARSAPAAGEPSSSERRPCVSADDASGLQRLPAEQGKAPAAGRLNRGNQRLATFGMGCFWGAEARFCAREGVLDTRVGYAGGHTKSATYRSVSSGRTGHAEVVQVTYDPSVISYEELLEIFWRGHDPTTPNRQGPDVGTQYRSMILYHDPEQQAEARDSVEFYSGVHSHPIVTEIVAAGKFHPAEDYHQRYLEKHGRATCRRRDSGK